MNFSKKTLALAVAGTLFSGGALAATGIGAGVPPGNPSTYASELLSTAPLAAGVADLVINTIPGVGYASGFFLRIDLSNGATWVAAPAAAGLTATDSTPALVPATIAGGGVGQSWLVLSFLPNAGQTFALNSAVALALGGAFSTVNKNPVAATITTYNGALPTPTGPTPPTGGSTVGTATFIDFQPGLVLTYTPPDSPILAPPGFFPVPAVADISATPPFTRFTESRNNADLGSLTFLLNATANGGAGAANNAGAPVTVAGMALGARLTVAGDFSARGSVALGAGVAATGCLGGVNGAVTDTTAVWQTPATLVIPFGFSRICYTVNGTTPIPRSQYTATMATTPNVGFGPAGGTVTLNAIIRNGVELQAPLAQTPAGWTSRIALSNTSGTPRNYVARVLAEGTDTVTLGAAATGTIPANQVLVLNVPDIVTITPADPNSPRRRATIVINVVGPDITNDDIQGTYQLISPTSNPTNMPMLRPGTN